MTRPATTSGRRRRSVNPAGDVPCYSRCCHQPVLPQTGFLCCHGCWRVLYEFRPPALRAAALAELRWEAGEKIVSLCYRNLRVAYARDVPDYHWRDDGYQIVNVTYKWVIGCSNADFGRIATALQLNPPAEFGYPGRDDFPTLTLAAADLGAYLHTREPAVPTWQK